MFCTNGNPGIDKFASPIDIKPTEIDKLTEFALKEKIDFTVVGPEIPLTLGIVNEFEKNGLKIFGPCKEAAQIESSKIFSKELMTEAGIPTASFRKFAKENLNEAIDFLNNCKYPVVIKADGLAAGKGVIIAGNFSEAEDTVNDFIKGEKFGNAGLSFVVEEFLTGEEVSVFAITDGTDYALLPFSQDHKKISEGETGKNTGGMGAIAPVKKFMNENLTAKIQKKIVEPVLEALRKRGIVYKGCLYCGLIIDGDDPKVIEFNCRFGDPEAQAVLPLIESDFLELLIASSNSEIKNYKLKIADEYSCCVVIASNGYPDAFETGKVISGTDNTRDNCIVFHSGTKYGKSKNEILSIGGRVLTLTGISKTSLDDAVKIVYENIGKINFENKYYRKDIGHLQLAKNSTRKEVVN